MPTLDSAFNDFILALRADGLSRSTIEWYRWTVGAFIAAHDGETHLVSDVTSHDCRVYIVGIRGQGYAEDTVSAHIRGLHRFWKWAANEYSVADPMRTIRYPQPRQPQPKAADMADILAMFAHAGEGAYGVRNRAILAFLLDTGCRAAGLVRLRAVDGERRAVHGRSAVCSKGAGVQNRIAGNGTRTHDTLLGNFVAGPGHAPGLIVFVN